VVVTNVLLFHLVSITILRVSLSGLFHRSLVAKIMTSFP
jgi:hypothetical protein